MEYDPMEVLGYDSGDFVIYTGASDEQVNYGGGDDPRGLLIVGHKYEVECVEVFDWRSSVRLVDFPTMEFNSVMFEPANKTQDEEENIMSNESASVTKLGPDYIMTAKEAADFIVGFRVNEFNQVCRVVGLAIKEALKEMTDKNEYRNTIYIQIPKCHPSTWESVINDLNRKGYKFEVGGELKPNYIGLHF